MNLCPNVKHVEFGWDRSPHEWCYFSKMLMDCDIWRLESLPPLFIDAGPISSICFNIAYYMRNSLQEVSLFPKMLLIGDFKDLSGFQQLTKINVKKRVLTNVYDIGKLLKYLPKVTSLYINGFK